MIKRNVKPIVWACFISVFAFVLGCEPEPTSNSKSERLFATENMRLKKELVQLEERLTKKYEEDMGEQQKLLKECNKQRDFLQKGANENMESFMGDVVEDMLNDIAVLRKENQELKTQIEQLKAKTDS